MTVVYGQAAPYEGVSLSLDPVAGDPPHVLVTLAGVGEMVVTIRRTCEGETQHVQGCRSVRVNNTGVFRDWAAPLNRTTVYMVTDSAGEAVVSAAVVLDSDTGWVQDPIRPDLALPVFEGGNQTTGLTLAAGAMSSATRPSEASTIQVMGSKYPRQLGGQRVAATDVDFSVLSFTERVADQFADLVDETPLLLLRTAHKRRILPPVAYLLADVVAEPLGEPQGSAATRWAVTGDLVAAVVQAVVTGQVTYGDVQELLGEYTYGEVQDAAQNTTYLDWLKDPLIFSSL